MSHLTYHSYPGFGTAVAEATHYSQSVRIGPILKLSGQGGWLPTASTFPPTFPKDAEAELAQAFATVEHALQHAGAQRGWKSVYSIRLYHSEPLGESILGRFKELMVEHCGEEHRPILTGVQVARLAFGMRFELEVEAHVPE